MEKVTGKIRMIFRKTIKIMRRFSGAYTRLEQYGCRIVIRKERENGQCPSSFPEAALKSGGMTEAVKSGGASEAGKWGGPVPCLRGSLTIEAAVCLPVLLFAVWLLLMPMRTMDELRRLQNTMEGRAKDIAQAAYLSNTAGNLLTKDEEKRESAKGLISGISSAAAEVQILGSIDRSILEAPAFAEETQILSGDADADENMIHMELTSRMRMPFLMLSVPGKELRSIVNRRAWTGAAGGRGRDKYGESLDEEEEDPIVYIGKNSTRYHRDRHCHYLSNVVETASGGSISTCRNSSGGKYHACPVCHPDPSGMVYYFKSGSAYHSSPECRAISAYVQSVRLSTVAHMGGCSYCSKGG